MRIPFLAFFVIAATACSAGETSVLHSASDGGTPPTTKDGGGGPGDSGSDGGSPDGGDIPACKRGIAYGYHSIADLTSLSAGIGWWYNWATKPDDGVGGAYPGIGVDFVPMVWGGTFDVATVEEQIPNDARYLLAFNEPNFGSQANLTPAQAAALWPKIEAIAKAKNLKIASPAVNYCGGSCNVTDPFEYLDQFFTACPSCQVDYVAVHWYACSKDALTWYLGQFESKYQKPLWLTEFSCLDAADTSAAVQQKYMKDALEVLEADPMVFRYAWFTGRSPTLHGVELLAGDGQLTPLGEQYVSAPGACR
jgi:hypothetical protein